MLSIDPRARISPRAEIEDSVRGSRIEIADGVVIDSFVKIKPAGGDGDVWIGRGSVVNSGCVLYTGNGIHIGENVLIAANCTLAPTNHAIGDPTKPIRGQGFMASRGGIIVEDDVWIGCNCVLLDGAILRRGCVVGASSLVRAEVPAYAIVAGNPLRLVGRRGAAVQVPWTPLERN